MNTSTVELEIATMEELATKFSGSIIYEGSKVEAEIEKINNRFVFRVNTIIDLQIDHIKFKFVSDKHQLTVDAPITATRNTLKIPEKLVSRYSEGKVDSFKSKRFEEKQVMFQRSYFFSENERLIYDYFGLKQFLPVDVNGEQYLISCRDKYLIVESSEKNSYEVFSESCYNIMVAIGFITGDFIQNETYTFQRIDKGNIEFSGYEYRKLRSSSHSMYHSLTHNPFAYDNFIGKEYAEDLYKNNILKPLDITSFSKLVELIENNSQIQYALVLFNEANNRHHSLLIQNNCLYAVLEVIKKFFFDKFEDKIPKEYYHKKNIEKYKLVFNNLIILNDDDLETLTNRNVFLHGDIKDMEGTKMIEVMQKQITLIYRLMLTFIGFDGYVIHHYAIRNNMPNQAFIKVN